MPVATKIRRRRKIKQKFEILSRQARNWLHNATLGSEMARRKSKPQPVCMRDMYLYEYNLIRLHMTNRNWLYQGNGGENGRNRRRYQKRSSGGQIELCHVLGDDAFWPAVSSTIPIIRRRASALCGQRNKFARLSRQARNWLLNATLWSEMARRKLKPRPVCMRDMDLYDYNVIRLHMTNRNWLYTKEMVAKMDEIADDIRRVQVEDK